jgi:hypothetical protein
VIRSHAKAEHSSHLPFTIHFFEICFRLGRNYALAATETVRDIRSISSHPQNVSGGRQECQEELFEPVVPGARVHLATRPGAARTTNRGEMLSDASRRRIALAATHEPSLAYSSPETSIELGNRETHR